MNSCVVVGMWDSQQMVFTLFSIRQRTPLDEACRINHHVLPTEFQFVLFSNRNA